MPVLNKIAYYQNRRDETPNQELARELFETSNHAGIREIVDNLLHPNPNVQSDCLKVLYEVGRLNPALIAGYAGDFLQLLHSKQNRLVWGGMIALSTIAPLKANELFRHVEAIKQAMTRGSVITVDNGVKVLAAIAAERDDYRMVIFPYLLHHLESCRPKDVPQHANHILVAVNATTRQPFIEVVEKRMTGMPAGRVARLKK